MQPLRQRASLQPNPLHRRTDILKPSDQSVRFTENFGLPNDPPLGVHHTHAGVFQRYIDPGIMLYGRLSMMLGAGPILTPLLMTPSF